MGLSPYIALEIAGGDQNYFGFEWPNEPPDYSRWLSRVEACSDYLVDLVRQGVA